MKVLELFPGAGGMAEGFRRAGLPVTLAVDWDRWACATYARNVGPHVIRADVRQLPIAESWAPDLIVADPPCQPWSTAGKRRGLGDPRDMLRPTVEIILRLRLAAVLLGNVPGLETRPARPQLVAAVIAPLRAAGYCVHESKRLDCADYGVPQRRVRPWWYAHRAGACIRWPEPTHADPRLIRRGRRQAGLFGPPTLLPWVTVRQALEGALPREEWGVEVRGKIHDDRNGRHGGSQSSRAQSEERVGDTVQCKQGRGHVVRLGGMPGRHDPAVSGYGHYGYIRLSERAAALLQAFPLGWVFEGPTKTARWRQIGNAVPPPMAEHIARAVMESIA